MPAEDYKLEEPGEVVIPSKEIMDIVKKMPIGYINVESTKHHTIQISSGKTRLEVVVMPPEEYPPFPSFEAKVDVTMHGRVLRSLIKRTVFAAAVECRDTPVLSGILMRSVSGTMNFIATDRKRAARAKEISDIELPNDIVLSARHSKEILSIFNDNDPVSINADKSQAYFHQRNLTAYVSVLDGTYPAIDKVFDSKSVTEVTFGVEELTQAVERVNLTSGSMDTASAKNVIKLNLHSKAVTLSSKSEAGWAEDVLTPISFKGQEYFINFNAQFLLDVLQVLESSEVNFKFTGARGPVLIGTPDNEDAYLISPVNFSEGG
ncbi:DNA polymerase III subunit beta [compost metagenome]